MCLKKYREFALFQKYFVISILISCIASFFACSKMTAQKTIQMDFFEIVHARRSVRNYQSTPVPQEHINKILDAARMAPTAGNQQPWKFLVIQDQTTIQKLKEACITAAMEWFTNNQKPTEESLQTKREEVSVYYNQCFSAPVYIVVLVDTKSQYPTYNRHDGPLAAGYLMLAARALGYGTVYYTDSVPYQVTQTVLNIPDRYERICITPIGIPNEWPETPPKKKLEELVAYEKIE